MKRIIPEVCTCRTRMGYKQRKYEEEKIKRMEENKDKTEKQIENDIIEEFLKFDKLCCRKNFLCNSRDAFIRNANKDAYMDCVGIGQLKKTRNECIRNDGPKLLPIIDLPPLP
jgi:hypothetical protein